MIHVLIDINRKLGECVAINIPPLLIIFGVIDKGITTDTSFKSTAMTFFLAIDENKS